MQCFLVFTFPHRYNFPIPNGQVHSFYTHALSLNLTRHFNSQVWNLKVALKTENLVKSPKTSWQGRKMHKFCPKTWKSRYSCFFWKLSCLNTSPSQIPSCAELFRRFSVSPNNTLDDANIARGVDTIDPHQQRQLDTVKVMLKVNVSNHANIAGMVLGYH